MKSFLIIVVLLATLAISAHAEDEACDMLFVQDAKAMVFDGSLLTLKEANPNIIFFCDRPVRTAGHMTRDAFMKLVSEGENSFADNPPNAAVSIIDAKGEVVEVVVTLSKKPLMSGHDMLFPIKVIDGELPNAGETVIMFIDPIGGQCLQPRLREFIVDTGAGQSDDIISYEVTMKPIGWVSSLKLTYYYSRRVILVEARSKPNMNVAFVWVIGSEYYSISNLKPIISEEIKENENAKNISSGCHYGGDRTGLPRGIRRRV